MLSSCFFFNDTATTEIYTLSLHDALPIFRLDRDVPVEREGAWGRGRQHLREHRVAIDGDQDRDIVRRLAKLGEPRSEEHTSELQSRQYLVCRLLLEKKKSWSFEFTTFSVD